MKNDHPNHSSLNIREATLDDLDLLIRLRLDFISMNGTQPSQDKETEIRNQLEKYYRKHIPSGDFIAFLAENKKQTVATAFMLIYERPAGNFFVSGTTAILLNVLTYPEHRKQGYASLLVEALIHKAKELNVSAIDLNATAMGEKLYRKLGFTPLLDTAMRLKL